MSKKNVRALNKDFSNYFQLLRLKKSEISPEEIFRTIFPAVEKTFVGYKIKRK
tara:strand:- start:499 stop:657 length:159 start_codon:yes stop_codon:yes gene_type:complete